jgi:hypothetical protein
MIFVGMFGIGLVIVFLYVVCSLPYVLVKLAFIKRNGGNAWIFLSRSRLAVMAGSLLVGGQVPWLFCFLLMAASSTGSNGGPGDEFWGATKIISILLSLLGLLCFSLLIIRPRDTGLPSPPSKVIGSAQSESGKGPTEEF